MQRMSKGSRPFKGIALGQMTEACESESCLRVSRFVSVSSLFPTAAATMRTRAAVTLVSKKAAALALLPTDLAAKLLPLWNALEISAAASGQGSTAKELALVVVFLQTYGQVSDKELTKEIAQMRPSFSGASWEDVAVLLDLGAPLAPPAFDHFVLEDIVLTKQFHI